MPTSPENPFSPAAAMTEFMHTTQTAGREIHRNILLFTPWYGEKWAKEQADKLRAYADGNRTLLGETARALGRQGMLPYVQVGEAIGTLDDIGTDHINAYQLATTIDGERHELSLEHIVLIDTARARFISPSPNIAARPLGARPTMRLGSILFSQSSLPYNSPI